MQVEYELTVEDVAAFQRYGKKRLGKPQCKLALWMVLAVLFFWFVVNILVPKAYSIYQEGRALWVGIPVLLGSALIARVVIKLIKDNSPEGLARRMFEQNPGFFRKTTVTLNPEEFIWDGASGREVRYWRAFLAIEQTADYAFFFTSPTVAYFVPRHAFPGEGAFANFIQTARRYHDEALTGRFGDRAKGEDAGQRITN